MRYFRQRLARLSASPHAVARGFSIGAFFAFSPLVGLHALMALAVAAILRGNLVAAVLGTALCNPLTLPFILGIEYEAGQILIGGTAHGFSAAAIEQQGLSALEPVIEPMLAGWVLLGLMAAAIGYALVFLAVARSRDERRRRIGLAAR